MLGLEEVVESFREISNMDVAVLDSKHRLIIRRYSSNRFCTLLHRAPKCLERCLESDRVHIEKAKDGPVKYVCPYGVHELIAPIGNEGHIKGYVFLSMGITEGEENSKKTLDEVMKYGPELNKAEVAESFASYPKYSKEKIEAYTKIIPLLVEYIENNNLLSEGRTIGELIKYYIKNHLSEKITLEEISISLHYSTVSLTEHFKEEFGMTIMEYVLKRRMEKAKNMLETEDLPIKEVGKACGFPEAGYFSRCYKDFYGVSPKEHKKKKTE